MKEKNEQGQFSALKILKHVDRISSLKRGELIYPVSIDLSLTNFCNHSCVWCYYEDFFKRAKTKLDREVVLSLIKEVKLLGVKGINFTGGGEPLTHPHTLEIMESAYDCGLDVGLITNGVLLTEDSIHRLVNIAKYIRISLSAASDAGYVKYHGAKSHDFERLCKNLQTLGRYAESKQCMTGMLFLIEARTQYELLNTIKLAKESKLKFFEARLVKDRGENSGYERIPEHLIMAAKEFEEGRFKVIIRDELFSEKTGFGKEYNVCYIHHFVTSISADGDVYLCCEFEGHQEYSFGNINKQTFETIWHSEKRKILLNRLDLSKCYSCCKGDGVNNLFDSIDKQTHANFL